MLTDFHKKVVELERKKLRAVQDKMPQAIRDRDIARVVGLANAAERIASRLLSVADNNR